ncbi:MAG: hypothetical protein J6B89_03300 [Bacilli bacterium]|nr:hypothetical protein [Bacilli bacterium]
MKNKSQKRKKVFISILSISIFIILTIIYLTVQNIIMQRKLSNEVEKLTSMDIMTDRYEVKVSTRGDYAKVEKAIKQYLKDYSESLQMVINILNDEKLKKVLSASNYKEDGPEFITTSSYLEKTQKDFNDNMNQLIKLTKKTEIMKYIEKENLDDYYVNLYREYMLDEGLETNIKNSQLQLEATTKSINNLINVDIEVISFLKETKDNWTVEEEKIVFYKQELLDKYNELVSKVN